MTKILKTGEVAKMCGVAPRTVVKWLDNGLLKGHRIPMSQHRRVLLSDLEEFAKEYGMPVDFEVSPKLDA